MPVDDASIIPYIALCNCIKPAKTSALNPSQRDIGLPEIQARQAHPQAFLAEPCLEWRSAYLREIRCGWRESRAARDLFSPEAFDAFLARCAGSSCFEPGGSSIFWLADPATGALAGRAKISCLDLPGNGQAPGNARAPACGNICISVPPRLRSQGYGKLLLSLALDKACLAGAGCAALHIDRANLASIACAKACQARCAGPASLSPHETLLLFRADLRQLQEPSPRAAPAAPGS